MKRILGLALLLSIGFNAQAQDIKTLPINRLIDNPTAGILNRGTWDFDMVLYSNGGVLVGFDVGLLDRLNMGASFGGTNIVSDVKPEWNQRPELSLKYRVIDESVLWPAFAIGYNSQGHGRWIDDDVDNDGENENRYEYKGPGFFVVAGKNYILGNFGMLGLHTGVNFNSMENDDDRGMNFYVGMDKEVNNELSVLTEYNFGLDDVDTGLSRDKGFLNLGVRWTFAERLSIELDFKDVLKNRRDLEGRPVDNIAREIKITYVELF